MKESIFKEDNEFFKSNELSEGGSLVKSKGPWKKGKKGKKDYIEQHQTRATEEKKKNIKEGYAAIGDKKKMDEQKKQKADYLKNPTVDKAKALGLAFPESQVASQKKKNEESKKKTYSSQEEYEKKSPFEKKRQATWAKDKKERDERRSKMQEAYKKMGGKPDYDRWGKD